MSTTTTQQTPKPIADTLSAIRVPVRSILDSLRSGAQALSTADEKAAQKLRAILAEQNPAHTQGLLPGSYHSARLSDPWFQIVTLGTNWATALTAKQSVALASGDGLANVEIPALESPAIRAHLERLGGELLTAVDNYENAVTRFITKHAEKHSAELVAVEEALASPVMGALTRALLELDDLEKATGTNYVQCSIRLMDAWKTASTYLKTCDGLRGLGIRDLVARCREVEERNAKPSATKKRSAA